MCAAILFVGIRNANSVQPVVAVERTVFYRERAAGMYSALPYAIAQESNFLFTNNAMVTYLCSQSFTFYLNRPYLFNFYHISDECT